MPWKTRDEIPDRLKNAIEPPPMSVEQANTIAEMAEALEREGEVDSPWAVAVAHFKKYHVRSPDGSGWVKRGGGQSEADRPTLGRKGGPEAAGPGGRCKCSRCGHEVKHDTGQPCYEVTCPQCGAKMTREVSTEEQETIGRHGGPEAAGPGGVCVCPKCEYEVPHETDEPCDEIKCPKCGAAMTRKPEEEKESAPFLALSLPAVERLVSGELDHIVHMGNLEEIVSVPVLTVHDGRVYAQVTLSQPVSIGSDVFSYDVKVIEVYDPPRYESTATTYIPVVKDTTTPVKETLLDERVSWRLPPFSSEGGNYFLAPTIRDIFPPHDVFVETHSGASNVLFSKHPVSTEVLNDTDIELIQAYESIRALTLTQLIELRNKNWYPWERRFNDLKENEAEGEVDCLYRFLYLSWYSFDSNRKDYRGRPKGWSLEARLGRIENARVRLREVKLTSEDGIACIKRWDGPTTAFFLDPPFPASGGDAAGVLQEVLRSIEGKFVLRISDTQEHRDLLSEYNIMSTSAVKRAGQASSWEDGEIVRARSELLVTNCDVPEP